MNAPTMEEMQAYADRQGVIMAELIAKGTPFMTAVVMAGDLITAEKIDACVAQGEKPEDLVWMVGSYARFDWAVKNLPREKLFEILPELWVSSDPDDTNPQYMTLWLIAKKRNKGRIITDGKALPKDSTLTVYRGQIGDMRGFAWTLDRKIAEKFAATGGGRGKVDGGKVLTREVKRSDVIAYLTSRNESEVIIGVAEPERR